MPNRLNTTHVLSQAFTFVGDGAISAVDYTFNGNNLHFPHTSLTPLGYTEMGGIYDHYQVNSCSISIVAHNRTTHAGTLVLVPVTVTPLTGMNATDVINLPKSKYRVFDDFQHNVSNLTDFQRSKVMFSEDLMKTASFAAAYLAQPTKQ